jgi:hypothetical protein
LATAALSEDVPVTEVVPLTVAPAAGFEMATEGAVVSAGGMETVIPTLDVEVSPDVSVALAVRVCFPALNPFAPGE